MVLFSAAVSGEERCVTTLITAVEQTKGMADKNRFADVLTEHEVTILVENLTSIRRREKTDKKKCCRNEIMRQ